MGAARSDQLGALAAAIDGAALWFIDHLDTYKNDIHLAWEGARKYGITWDIDYSSWELFPPTQKWFAFGETLAHLKYLEEERAIHSLMKQSKVLFSLT